VQRFWSWLGLNLGKHWIAVMVIGGIVTLGLGYGTTKLKFSTDQSNYLNTSDQVYKDNVAYQKLFGGEAMITLVTMDPGHTVAELFTPDGIKQWTSVSDTINASGMVLNVVSPLTALQ
jgi:predicted RND superfamily exporter protein